TVKIAATTVKIFEQRLSLSAAETFWSGPIDVSPYKQIRVAAFGNLNPTFTVNTWALGVLGSLEYLLDNTTTVDRYFTRTIDTPGETITLAVKNTDQPNIIDVVVWGRAN